MTYINFNFFFEEFSLILLLKKKKNGNKTLTFKSKQATYVGNRNLD